MSDGLTVAFIAFLVVLAGVAVGVFLWVNRRQRPVEEDSPRIQPLFGSEHARALDEDPNDDLVLQSSPTGRRTPAAADRVRPMASEAAAEAAEEREELMAVDPAVGAEASAEATEAALASLRQRSAAAGGGRATRIPPSWRPAAPALSVERSPVVKPFTPPAASPAMGPPATPFATPFPPTASPRPAGAGAGRGSSDAIRFAIPTDGTLQFLPGRLEALSGSERGREIRFVRQPGFEAPTVTFGRNEGEPYRHVQLVDATVSRMHARMRLSDAGWHLANLSTTNPVSHNARVMTDGEEVLLQDGDRVEMGEVVFRFRSR